LFPFPSSLPPSEWRRGRADAGRPLFLGRGSEAEGEEGGLSFPPPCREARAATWRFVISPILPIGAEKASSLFLFPSPLPPGRGRQEKDRLTYIEELARYVEESTASVLSNLPFFFFFLPFPPLFLAPGAGRETSTVPLLGKMRKNGKRGEPHFPFSPPLLSSVKEQEDRPATNRKRRDQTAFDVQHYSLPFFFSPPLWRTGQWLELGAPVTERTSGR